MPLHHFTRFVITFAAVC